MTQLKDITGIISSKPWAALHYLPMKILADFFNLFQLFTTQFEQKKSQVYKAQLLTQLHSSNIQSIFLDCYLFPCSVICKYTVKKVYPFIGQDMGRLCSWSELICGWPQEPKGHFHCHSYLTQWPLEDLKEFWISTFQATFSDWWLICHLCNCPLVKVTGPHWW